MTDSSEPREILLRVYQVGFGDCFLLTFRYGAAGEDDRHLLIDFGSTEVPNGAPERSVMLLQIANDIKSRCGGKLYAVIATHRHADHINGFAIPKPKKTRRNQEQKSSGDIIRECRPEVVLQPWTEQPDAPEDPLTQSFQAHLQTLHAFAATVDKHIPRLRGVKGSSDVLNALQLFAANNVGGNLPANLSAIENLRTMGERPPLFLSYGQSSGLELPGVKVHVLGPPTLAQSREILRQRASYSDEFWQLLKDSRPILDSLDPLFDTPATATAQWTPQHARWLVRRLGSLRSEQLLEMVRVLDDVLNNTSLILLFEAGDKKLLFPGDAQWENWSYALNQEGIADLLKDATLYKVGHHGSRNATPKSLWKLINGKDLISVMSTKPDRHGKIDRRTEVPRATLVQELQKRTLLSTQDMGWAVSSDGEPPSQELKFTPRYGRSPAQRTAPTSAEPPS
jgi:hypothetical protein